MKNFKGFCFFLFLLLGLKTLAIGQEEIIVRGNCKENNVKISALAKNNGLVLRNLVVDLPLPLNSMEQEITNIRKNGGKEVNEKSFSYIMFDYIGKTLQKAGSEIESYIQFTAKTYDIFVDFSKIKNIVPYDVNSEIYLKYASKSNLPIIDKDNPEIAKIAGEISKINPDILNYAKACYEYVASKFRYLNPNTGLHPLSELMKAGGGDCGNLSSIYISLLRHRGIPARHVVSLRADGTFHVWAEFYLEKIGWIPVDVTFKNLDNSGDYFGKLTGKNSGIIVNRDINLKLFCENGKKCQVPLFQNFAYWYWFTSGKGKVDIEYSIKKIN
ncbi:MAG: transglutaminase domain-containing protein [Candidatus Riflebacteria bacterium]|nr:transglutaminase domain-containing protein [Candidatus Riflebacteria bacterium]